MTDVVVSVKGFQRDGIGDEECMEFVTKGRRYQRDGTIYITYDESELTGLEGTTTMLKIYADHVVLVRTGIVRQHQEFRSGGRSCSTYSTPYGTMDMAVVTRHLSTSDHDGRMDIYIVYDLEIEKCWQSSNRLAITIREEKKKDGYETVAGGGHCQGRQ